MDICWNWATTHFLVFGQCLGNVVAPLDMSFSLLLEDQEDQALVSEVDLSAIFVLSSVQFSSVAQSCLTLCDPMNCSTPGLPVHHQLPEFTQAHVHRVGDAIQPSHPLLSLLLLPSFLPSIEVFSKESVLHIRWPKYWNVSIRPSNEHPGLISFRMDWLDLLAVQGTLKSFLQHHSSKKRKLNAKELMLLNCGVGEDF